MNRKVTILHVIYSFYPSYTGGRETLISGIIKEKKHNQRISLCVVSFRRPKEPKQVTLGETSIYRILGLPYFTSIGYTMIVANMLLLALKSIREASRQHIQIVHLHNPGTESPAGLLLKKIFKTKLIVHVHGYVKEELSQNLPLLRFLWRYLYRKCLNEADAVIFVSRSTLEHAFKEGLHLKKAMVVMQGVDLQRFSPEGMRYKKFELLQQAGLTVGEKAPIIVAHIATIRPFIKGQDITIKAAAIVTENFPEAYFIFVGKGDQTTLRRMAETLNISNNVGFLGERRDIPQILRSVDIVVNPSRFEGLPLTLLEAMACGKPIIATNIGGVRDLIDHNVDGLLIHPSETELAKAIIDVMEHKDLSQKLSKMARNKVKQFEWKNMAEKVFGLYEELSQTG